MNRKFRNPEPLRRQTMLAIASSNKKTQCFCQNQNSDRRSDDWSRQMVYGPNGTRAFKRELKAHTVLDNVARHFTVGPFPKGTGGKFRKDDSSAKGVQDYLAARFVDAMVFRRRGEYRPTWIVKNFFR